MGLEQIKVELQDWMGSDRSIANAAWTSSMDKEKREDRDDAAVGRIIKFMAEHKHGTPFESVVFRFWYRWPIFTDRQHMTHRIASHNGLSGRYRTSPTDFYDMPREVIDIFTKASPERLDPGSHFYGMYKRSLQGIMELYESGLFELKAAETEGRITNAEYKRAREVVRGLVPVAGMTERTTMVNLRSFANYQKLRNSDHAQPEIAYAARLMLNEVITKDVCPVAVRELENNGWQI